MATAFVLLKSELGRGTNVESDLRKIKKVKEIYAVYGVYDYIAKVETENIDELRDLVSGKIRQIDNIISTLTLIAIE